MCQIWKVFVKNLLEILKIEKTCIKKSNFQQFEKLENGATLSPHSPWGQSSGAESELLLSGGTKASNPLCLHSPPSLMPEVLCRIPAGPTMTPLIHSDPRCPIHPHSMHMDVLLSCSPTPPPPLWIAG